MLTPIRAAISLNSLRLLARHPNPDIRHASTRILIKRFLSDPKASNTFRSELISINPNTRIRANLVADLLSAHGFGIGHIPDTEATLQATTAPASSAQRQHLRLPSGALDSEGTVVIGEDGRTAQISGATYTLPTRVVENVLTMRRRRRGATTELSLPASAFASSSSNDGTEQPLWEESPEEMELRRRRHREAMVLNEGEGEPSIFQGPTGRFLEWQGGDSREAMTAEAGFDAGLRGGVVGDVPAGDELYETEEDDEMVSTAEGDDEMMSTIEESEDESEMSGIGEGHEETSSSGSGGSLD